MNTGLSFWADLGIAAAGFAGIVAATVAVVWARTVPGDAVAAAGRSVAALQRLIPTGDAAPDADTLDAIWAALTSFDRAATALDDQILARAARALAGAIPGQDWAQAHLALRQAQRRVTRLEHRRQR